MSFGRVLPGGLASPLAELRLLLRRMRVTRRMARFTAESEAVRRPVRDLLALRLLSSRPLLTLCGLLATWSRLLLASASRLVATLWSVLALLGLLATRSLRTLSTLSRPLFLRKTLLQRDLLTRRDSLSLRSSLLLWSPPTALGLLPR